MECNEGGCRTAWFGDVAFASLGTNDLTQYALAVDRGNPSLERYRDAMHPAVLRLIAMAADSAERAGIPLSVCGEMGGDPAAAEQREHEVDVGRGRHHQPVGA